MRRRHGRDEVLQPSGGSTQVGITPCVAFRAVLGTNGGKNLTSVFYHAAEGSQVYTKYIDYAAREGDEELVEFFKDVQEQDAWRVQKAKSLISRR